MTLVTAPIAIAIRRILGVPSVARIIAGSSRAAVNLDPDVETIVLAPQRSAAAGFKAVPVDRIGQDHQKQHGPKPAEPPSVGRIVAEHTDLLSPRGPHV